MIATAPLTPDRTALVLIDDPYAPVPPRDAAVADGAAALLARARRSGAHVVHVRQMSESGRPDAGFQPAVPPRPGEPVIEKRGHSAFDGTALGRELAARGVESVVLAELAVGTGCTATAQEALVRRYRTLVASEPSAAERHGPVRRLGVEVLSGATIGALLEADG